MQGINRNWLPGEAKETLRPKIIPAKPATQSNNPDLTQFNYGRCLPWFEYLASHEGKGPAEYLRTEYLQEAIARRALELSTAAWDLQMALREVRTADNGAEFHLAISKLRLARIACDKIGLDGTYNQANMPHEPADYRYGENL